MSDDTRNPAEDPDAAAEASLQEGIAVDPAQEAAAEATETVAAQFAAEKERLEAEVAALKDKFLRAFAEADNVRRRAEREVADAKVYGITGFARDVVTVADDFERALSTIDPEAREKADGTLKTLLEGIDLTARALTQTLSKHGVARIEAEGAKFDPNLHQAMFEVPNTELPSGTVVQVIQSGYTIGGRVLRPALVGVSKGGPKVASPSDSGTAETK
ncbi:nucleotide exchange factor GrpE [Ancylobacter sp. A5.8]|uniref:nucleotide exchange factor GrpE n=1 Tax=Ancylobacter gelatini TaxID=2919920 RepID=UPI001F4D424A|nr:nucleotide exchange factor GrpE [Ancylobacter gelatini]MCJ8144452.1 nucleotide exchange factor GrpE [Ancylobacter gelatini]